MYVKMVSEETIFLSDDIFCFLKLELYMLDEEKIILTESGVLFSFLDNGVFPQQFGQNYYSQLFDYN